MLFAASMALRRRLQSLTSVEEQFLPAKLLQALQAAALLQIIVEIRQAVNVFVEKLFIAAEVRFHFQPRTEVRFVREILIGHVAGIASEGYFTDGVDTEKRNAGLAGIAANLVIGKQALTRDDELLGGAGE